MNSVRIPKLPTQPSENKLLASLPFEDYCRLEPHLKRVRLRAREVLYKQDAPIDGIVFPSGGACRLVKSTGDGHTSEIAVIGAEGAIGASVFFGLPYAPCDVIAEVATDAHVLPASVFKTEMEKRGALYNRVIRYSQALMMQLMQSTVCSGLHSAEERCARWLLATHDRAGQDDFRFTHEFVATMLGLRRPTVTLIIGRLQAAGLIKSVRGAVTVLDRQGLEAASCECYSTVRSTYSRLLPE